MIRRAEHQTAAGPCWLLISQVDHARLSANLAERWGASPVAPLHPRHDVLAAVLHHDDGWAAWEQQPEVDDEQGQPLNFTEMPLATAVDIWRRSIAACAAFGPLAGWIVSRHFAVLLDRASSWEKTEAERELAGAFRREQQSQADGWLSQWQSTQARHSAERAERGLAQLQLFDLLSLWLCCDEPSQPAAFDTPGGPAVTFSPAGTTISVSPWPFTSGPFTVGITAREVEARHYGSAIELAEAPSRQVELRWQFRPAD